jgi:excinuclease ABC subunit B
MLQELGYCPGIENYSRYFDGRLPGQRPFCLLDYFPEDFITIIDESHVTIPQVRAMYGGDHSRKQTLVEYGFRMPSAIDNRPLKFDEFETLVGQMIFVSATPADFELEKSEGIIVEQLIRPTGLLDPVIEIRPALNQIDDLLKEARKCIDQGDRVLITTLTKRMAEELTQYLARLDIKCRYIHSDVETLERIEIMEGLRSGVFDVLVGVNLLREGLDLPEVSLVAILDADKEGFLRSERSLTQTAGRAARHLEGRVIMYANKITESMHKTIDETNRRREVQLAYNEANGITPRQIVKAASNIMNDIRRKTSDKPVYVEPEKVDIAADPVVRYMSSDALEKAMAKARKSMEKSAAELNFIEAARFRDEMLGYKKLLEEKIRN